MRILLAFYIFQPTVKYDHHQTFLYFSYLLPDPVKPANRHKVRMDINHLLWLNQYFLEDQNYISF